MRVGPTVLGPRAEPHPSAAASRQPGLKSACQCRADPGLFQSGGTPPLSSCQFFSAGHLALLVTLDVRLWLLGQIVKRECGSEDWGLMTFCIRDPIHLKCGDCRGIEEWEVISVRPRRGADDGSVDLTRPPNAIEMRAPSL